MGVITACFLFPFYLLLRTLIHTIRNVVWFVDGTRAAILTADAEYERSAQVLNIWGRFKLDVLLSANFRKDFIAFHDRFVHPRYVLRDEVSLYHVTETHAVFVECRPGDTAWDIRDYSFSRTGQFRKAVKLIVLPIAAARRLAQDIDHSERGAQDKFVFVTIVTRCGSTLLCQLFQKKDQCQVYSEPAAIADVCKFCERHPDDLKSQAEFLTLTIKLLCKPCERGPAVHMLKLAPPAEVLVPMIRKAFPEATCLFMYRDVREVLQSLYKVSVRLPLAIVLGISSLLVPAVCDWLLSLHGLNHPDARIRDLKWGMKTVYGRMAMSAFHPMHCYLQMLNTLNANDKRFAAVRYRDITKDPRGMVEKIFHCCGLPADWTDPAMEAYKRDSQRNSLLSRQSLGGVVAPAFTPQVVAEVNLLCRELDISGSIDDIFLPGTL